MGATILGAESTTENMGFMFEVIIDTVVWDKQWLIAYIVVDWVFCPGKTV
jgi:hypothetical protein